MKFENKERLEQIRNALVLLYNEHQNEFTPFERDCICDAYYSLVDIFDKEKAEKFNDEWERIRLEIELRKRKINA